MIHTICCNDPGLSESADYENYYFEDDQLVLLLPDIVPVFPQYPLENSTVGSNVWCIAPKMITYSAFLREGGREGGEGYEVSNRHVGEASTTT